MTPSPPAVRWLVAEDAALMAAIHRECFGDAWSADACSALLRLPGTFGITDAAMANGVAPEDDCGHGFILCRVAADEAEVLTIAVRSQFRRYGVARRLLAEALVVARGLGARQLFLEVGENNAAARRLYASMGWQINGRRPGYYRSANGQAVDALIMARVL